MKMRQLAVTKERKKEFIVILSYQTIFGTWRNRGQIFFCSLSLHGRLKNFSETGPRDFISPGFFFMFSRPLFMFFRLKGYIGYFPGHLHFVQANSSCDI